jgi:hypothetical protein
MELCLLPASAGGAGYSRRERNQEDPRKGLTKPSLCRRSAKPSAPHQVLRSTLRNSSSLPGWRIART